MQTLLLNQISKTQIGVQINGAGFPLTGSLALLDADLFFAIIGGVE